MFSLRSWLMSMTWSLRVVLRWSKSSFQSFRKSAPSSMSISSLERTRWSSWEGQSKDSRMATSRWSFLRSSLMSCSRSLRSLAKSQPQDSNFGPFRRSKGSVWQSHSSEVQESCRDTSLAQLRDDLKYPIKEFSRSFISPQDQDIKNLIHMLKYVNLAHFPASA